MLTRKAKSSACSRISCSCEAKTKGSPKASPSPFACKFPKIFCFFEWSAYSDFSELSGRLLPAALISRLHSIGQEGSDPPGFSDERGGQGRHWLARGRHKSDGVCRFWLHDRNRTQNVGKPE